MIPRYELHIGDKIRTGKLEDLQWLSKTTKEPWALYVFYMSSANLESQSRNLTPDKIEEARRLRKKGMSYESIGSQLKISVHKISSILKQVSDHV